MYFATVDWAIPIPSISNSPWMRAAPHKGLAILICRSAHITRRRSLGVPLRDEISSVSRLGTRNSPCLGRGTHQAENPRVTIAVLLLGSRSKHAMQREIARGLGDLPRNRRRESTQR